VNIGFQPTLSVDGGRTSRPGGSNGLSVGVVLHVATREHTIDIRAGGFPFGEDVAVFVEFYDPFEEVE
jgi:hypothetical protein